MYVCGRVENKKRGRGRRSIGSVYYMMEAVLNLIARFVYLIRNTFHFVLRRICPDQRPSSCDIDLEAGHPFVPSPPDSPISPQMEVPPSFPKKKEGVLSQSLHVRSKEAIYVYTKVEDPNEIQNLRQLRDKAITDKMRCGLADMEAFWNEYKKTVGRKMAKCLQLSSSITRKVEKYLPTGSKEGLFDMSASDLIDYLGQMGENFSRLGVRRGEAENFVRQGLKETGLSSKDADAAENHLKHAMREEPLEALPHSSNSKPPYPRVPPMPELPLSAFPLPLNEEQSEKLKLIMELEQAEQEKIQKKIDPLRARYMSRRCLKRRALEPSPRVTVESEQAAEVKEIPVIPLEEKKRRRRKCRK